MAGSLLTQEAQRVGSRTEDSSAPDAAIHLDDIHLTLQGGSGPVNVLRGVSLRVQRGEILSIVGPSGSGKTTMLMVMAGLERPSSGQVIVDGQSLGELDEDGLARFRRGRVGVVFQGFHLVGSMTALENVALPLELAGREDAMDRAADSLATVGLAARRDHYPSQLSGGEQQRVAIARAFAGEPSLLLADEPTGNLDAATGRIIMELLMNLSSQHGATLVLITHDAGLAAMADRTTTLLDGRIQDNRSAAPAQAHVTQATTEPES